MTEIIKLNLEVNFMEAAQIEWSLEQFISKETKKFEARKNNMIWYEKRDAENRLRGLDELKSRVTEIRRTIGEMARDNAIKKVYGVSE